MSDWYTVVVVTTVQSIMVFIVKAKNNLLGVVIVVKDINVLVKNRRCNAKQFI